MLVLMACPSLSGLEAFVQALANSGADVIHARTGMSALELARVRHPALVVVGGGLNDFKPLELVAQLVRVDAAIQAAVMSETTEENFHVEAEGLGVLARLPVSPGGREGAEVMARLKGILGSANT